MKRHSFPHRFLAGAMLFMALTCGAPVANADPEPVIPAPPPGLTNEILQQTPGSVNDPRDRDGPRRGLPGRGMQCQNLWARCR
jgi:hypothetical protein